MDTLEFDQNGIADGKGRDRFFTTAFNYNPIATRTIPFSTLGAGFAVGEEKDSLFVFAVVNTEDTATTSGFSKFFADGAAIFGELRLLTQFFGRSEHQMFGGIWSSRTFTSLNQSQRLEFPDVPIAEKNRAPCTGTQIRSCARTPVIQNAVGACLVEPVFLTATRIPCNGS